MADDLSIRMLGPGDALQWRDLRIAMLRGEPEAFHADLGEAEARDERAWRDSIPAQPDALFGLFRGGELVGSANCIAEKSPKLAHKAWLMAVYVVPELRGRGWGRKLVRAVIEHAREHFDVLLTGASRAGAPVYRAEGFETFGIERDASRVDGKSIDDELMSIHFRRRTALRNDRHNL